MDHFFRSDIHASSGNRLGNIIDMQSLISRVAADAVSQMEQIAYLFSHASYMLRMKMSSFACGAGGDGKIALGRRG